MRKPRILAILKIKAVSSLGLTYGRLMFSNAFSYFLAQLWKKCAFLDL